MGNLQIYQGKHRQRLHVDLLNYIQIFGRIKERPIEGCGSKQDNVLRDVYTTFLPRTATQILRQGNKRTTQTKRNNIKTTLHTKEETRKMKREAKEERRKGKDKKEGKERSQRSEARNQGSRMKWKNDKWTERTTNELKERIKQEWIEWFLPGL